MSRDAGRLWSVLVKSQDIFLLLKLASLAHRDAAANRTGHAVAPAGWRDWLADEDSDRDLLRALHDSGAASEADASKAYGVRALADSTGISKTQVGLALQRCYDVGLAKPDRLTGVPRANNKALLEFVVYGLRYVFPAKPGEVTRGIATGLGAPVLEGKLMTAGELVPVWPDPHGSTKGVAVEPLYKTVTGAVRRDSRVYALLALTDAIRLGQPRERNLAAELLAQMLRDER